MSERTYFREIELERDQVLAPDGALQSLGQARVYGLVGLLGDDQCSYGGSEALRCEESILGDSGWICETHTSKPRR